MRDRSEVLKLLCAQWSASDISKKSGVLLRTVQRIKQTGGAVATSRQPGGGRKRTTRTPAVIRKVAKRIKDNIRKLAREMQIPEGYCKGRPWIQVPGTHKMSPNHGSRQRAPITAVQENSQHMKNNKFIILFSDEKIFTVDAKTNSKNDPLDYAFCAYVEARTNKTPHKNLDHLKAAIKREWRAMSVDYAISTCKSFRKRLEKVVAAKGSHME
jgi:hypothetical protein